MTITGDTTYSKGDQLTLRCVSTGGPDLQYRWSRSGTDNFPHDVITNTDILIINVTAADGGEYTCTVSNDAGSNSATITVHSEFINVLIISCVKPYNAQTGTIYMI